MDALPDAPPLRFPGQSRRKRGARISRMFDRIAPTYDLLNHLLSANVDQRWRRRTVELLHPGREERVLDVCTGTGDLAMALDAAGAGEVVACDFSEAMVERAKAKAGGRIAFQIADTTDLPFPDASFDAATVGFGVRNLEDLDAGLCELRRVLRPGGRLAVLEFSRPPNPIFRAVYDVYFMLILPLVGNLVSGGADSAYTYLPRSVQAFPGPARLTEHLEAAGFASVDVHRLSMGIACIHLAHV